MAGTTVVNQIQLGDGGTATNNFVIRTNLDGTLTLARGNVGATSQDILRVTADGAIGYGAGTGGLVTQATSKATAVTLNEANGRVTTNNAALSANTTVSFQVNNTLVDPQDSIVLTLVGGGSIANYNVWAQTGQVGAFTVFLRNISAGSLSDPIDIGFMVFKGVTT